MDVARIQNINDKSRLLGNGIDWLELRRALDGVHVVELVQSSHPKFRTAKHIPMLYDAMAATLLTASNTSI